MDVPQTKSSKMLHVQELSSQLQLSHSNSVTLVHKLRNRGGGGGGRRYLVGRYVALHA